MMNVGVALGQLVASVSASSVISHAVAALVPGKTNKLTKIGLVIGGAIIGNMVGDAAAKYVKEVVDVLTIKDTPDSEV